MKEFLKGNITHWSLILCFLLPPVGIFLLFFSGLKSLYENAKKINYSLYSAELIFFLCLFTATIGASIELKNALYALSSVMIVGYFGLYIKIRTIDSTVSFRQYRWIMIFGGLYSCLIGWMTKWIHVSTVMGLLTGTVLFGEKTPIHYSRLIGSAYNPNFTVYLLLLSLAFLLVECLITIRKKQWLSTAWEIPVLLTLSIGIVKTGSRAGFMIMGFLYLLFFIRWSKRNIIPLSILAIIGSKKVYMMMPRSDLVDHSMNVREKIWEYGLKVWEQHPIFGTTSFGFQQEFADALKHTYKKIPHSLLNVPHSHDMYIGIFAEYGIVGGAAFLLLIMVNFRQYILLFFKKPKKNLDFFLFSLPVILLSGILDEPVFSPQIVLLSIFLFGFWRRYTDKAFASQMDETTWWQKTETEFDKAI